MASPDVIQSRYGDVGHIDGQLEPQFIEKPKYPAHLNRWFAALDVDRKLPADVSDTRHVSLPHTRVLTNGTNDVPQILNGANRLFHERCL